MPVLPTERIREELMRRLEPEEHIPDAWDHYGPGHELMKLAAELLVRAEAAEAEKN